MLEDLMEGLGMLPQAIEIVSAGALVLGFVVVTGLWVVERHRKGPVLAVERYRQSLGRVILIGLELLVAATIVKTITLEPTLEGMGRLAVMVAIRTILGWTTVLEVSGRWPWESARPATTHSDPMEVS
jgi:uncharacterized membrane protein